jgi:hypothetical protein
MPVFSFSQIAGERRTAGLITDWPFHCCRSWSPSHKKYALVVLLWPAMLIPRLTKLPVIRSLIYCATILVLIQPLAQGAAAQRFLQVLGMDFAATALLAIAIGIACVDEVRLKVKS